MKLDGAVFALPELVRLSMVICPIHNEGGLRISLPKLKHLALIGYSLALYPQEVAFLNRLAPNLVSFTASLSSINHLPSSILDHSTLPILYTTRMLSAPTPTFQGVRHLLRPVLGQDFKDWTDKIKDSIHQIKTLTLMWFGGGTRPDASVAPLLAACRARNIEVIWEHRPDTTTPAGKTETFFDHVPTSFIRRSEARQVST